MALLTYGSSISSLECDEHISVQRTSASLTDCDIDKSSILNDIVLIGIKPKGDIWKLTTDEWILIIFIIRNSELLAYHHRPKCPL